MFETLYIFSLNMFQKLKNLEELPTVLNKSSPF